MLMGPLREIVTACLWKEPNRRPSAQQILLRLLSHEGVVLPGAGAGTPAPTTILQEGAQVAAEGAPSGAYTPAGDTPPPGTYRNDLPSNPYGGDTPPPEAYRNDLPSNPYGGDTPPYGRVPGADTPPPGPYGPPTPDDP